MENLQKLLDLFNNKARIAQFFGMRLEFDSDSNAIITLPYNPNLDHALGSIHGGVYATMLDNAGWFTATAHINAPNVWVATTEMSMHFLLPATETSLRATAKVIKKGKRQAIVEMFLYDGDDKLVGHATGTFMVVSNVPM